MSIFLRGGKNTLLWLHSTPRPVCDATCKTFTLFQRVCHNDRTPCIRYKYTMSNLRFPSGIFTLYIVALRKLHMRCPESVGREGMMYDTWNECIGAGRVVFSENHSGEIMTVLATSKTVVAAAVTVQRTNHMCTWERRKNQTHAHTRCTGGRISRSPPETHTFCTRDIVQTEKRTAHYVIIFHYNCSRLSLKNFSRKLCLLVCCHSAAVVPR